MRIKKLIVCLFLSCFQRNHSNTCRSWWPANIVKLKESMFWPSSPHQRLCTTTSRMLKTSRIWICIHLVSMTSSKTTNASSLAHLLNLLLMMIVRLPLMHQSTLLMTLLSSLQRCFRSIFEILKKLHTEIEKQKRRLPKIYLFTESFIW